MRKLVYTVIALIGSFYFGYSQQDTQYTQYMYNTMIINPAYAGTRETLNISALYRSQWLGLDGAPTSQTFNLHSPASKRVGLGLSVVNDRIGNGTVQETDFNAVFSYIIPLGEEAKISLGLMAGGNLLNIDFNSLRNFSGNASGVQNIDEKFSPNIGIGAYYYSDLFYVGLSAPSLLETEHFDSSESGGSSIRKDKVSANFISGYVFDLNSNLKFMPSGLLRVTSGAAIQADISANFLYNEGFRLGVAYRSGSTFSGLVGFNVNDRVLIGLAYDKETSALGNTRYSSGSLELFMRFEFLNGDRNIVSPRMF